MEVFNLNLITKDTEFQSFLKMNENDDKKVNELFSVIDRHIKKYLLKKHLLSCELYTSLRNIRNHQKTKKQKSKWQIGIHVYSIGIHRYT